jgi:hypothetical protein
MYTKPTSIEELKQIWTEILFTKTSKVTVVGDESILNAIAYGCAKVGQKALKDVALIETHLFPDSAYDTYLDNIAGNFGISSRFGSIGSSTYLRLVADVGTTYLSGTHLFRSTDGNVFELEEDVVIGSLGYDYVKVRSQNVGLTTNSEALTINSVSPSPTGHLYVINEFKATGGRDIEDDDTFRKRIKEGANVLARGTVSMLEQVFIKLNPNVLKVFYHGIDDNGRVVIAIATQNGANLTNTELNSLLQDGSQYFSMTEYKPDGENFYGIYLKNIDYHAIDISLRVELYSGYNPDDVRKEMQSKMARRLDFRYWDNTKKVEWDDLLETCKYVRGVKYVPDQYFYPSSDVVIDQNKLPRVRGFLMMDLDGNVISNVSGTLNPVYYPNKADFSYQQTVLNSL